VSEPLWKWDNDPNVRNKKCAHCSECMRLDVATAVRYRDVTYHQHCLLDYLTKFHHENYVEYSPSWTTSWGQTP